MSFEKTANEVRNYVKEGQVAKTLSKILLGNPWSAGGSKFQGLLGGRSTNAVQDMEMFGRLLGALAGGVGGAALGSTAGQDNDSNLDEILGGVGGGLLGAMAGSRIAGGATGLEMKLKDMLGGKIKGSALDNPLLTGHFRSSNSDVAKIQLGHVGLNNLMTGLAAPLTIPLLPITNQLAMPVSTLAHTIASGAGSLIPR